LRGGHGKERTLRRTACLYLQLEDTARTLTHATKADAIKLLESVTGEPGAVVTGKNGQGFGEAVDGSDP
jgi:hypothetical protein